MEPPPYGAKTSSTVRESMMNPKPFLKALNKEIHYLEDGTLNGPRWQWEVQSLYVLTWVSGSSPYDLQRAKERKTRKRHIC